MATIETFPHCRPQARAYSGSFMSHENALEFAKVQGYNVLVNEDGSNTYYMDSIVKVIDHGELKYAYGKNRGNKCDCMYTHRSGHHQKDEARGTCSDPNRLLDEVDSLFVPVSKGQKGYNSTTWRIDSYKMVSIDK